MSVFFASYAPRPRMLVFGAIDFAAALARLGTFLGYHVTVCDARAVFATPAHALPRKRLSAATAYCAFQAGSKSPMVVRVNYALHALMTLAMIAMLFHGWDWPLLPQLLAFALAAWWFTVQASSTLAQHAIHRGGHPRGKSLHDAFVMAAMGVMLAAPQFAGTPPTSHRYAPSPCRQPMTGPAPPA
jgi:hypothetical protein